jgi:hypothetical protein
MNTTHSSETTMTGYLTSVRNPNCSGLATVVFRSSKRITKRTKYTTTYVEAGFGVRQLVTALGDGRGLTKESGEVKLVYGLDGFGILSHFAPLD